MRRTLAAAIAGIIVMAGSPATGAAGSAAEPAGCRRDAATAAASLVDENASVAGRSQVAGLDVTTATDWRIAPGFPTALLRVSDAWCSVERFNDAAAEQLAGAGASMVATAFASVAAMPFLGDVVVEDVALAGPMVTLTTKGGRHGAVSDWTILLDERGVRSATFTTTGWDPGATLGGSAGDLEGITSLPGHTRTFLRTADGRVVIDATVDTLLARSVAERETAVARAAAATGMPPGDDLKYTFEDGFTIHVSYGMSPYTPDAGIDTGVKHADRLRTVLAGVVSHYKDFLRWGMRDPFDNTSRTFLGSQTGLPEAAGYINVDSPLSPVCLACSYLADAMEVHIALLFPELAPELVPVSYPDSEKFMQSVIGHEMVHSMQGGYGNAQSGAFGSAFVEGSARASEALHDIAQNNFQTGAIHFNDSANGCEGFENGRGGWITAQAAGPFVGHTYDACYFWWTYLAGRGPEGLGNLMKAIPEGLAGGGGVAALNLRLLAAASDDDDGTIDLARWGAAAALGNAADGYTIPVGQTGTKLNWFSLLQPATRAASLQASQTVAVSNGGFRAYLVQEEGKITSVPAGAVTCTFDNVERQLVPTPTEVGSRVVPGQVVVVVAPSASSVSGSLTMLAGPVEPDTDPPAQGCG